jgi:hypothetical protein
MKRKEIAWPAIRNNHVAIWQYRTIINNSVGINTAWNRIENSKAYPHVGIWHFILVEKE